MNNKLYKNIELLLFNKKKSYSEHTKKTYYNRLLWIKNKLNISSNSVTTILNSSQVIKIIEDSDMGTSSKKGTYIMIYSLCKEINMGNRKRDEYKKKMEEYNDRDNKIKGKDEILDNNKWCTWNELCSIYNLIDESTYAGLQDKIIIGLYTRLEGYIFRLDFGEVIITLTKPQNNDHNYIYCNQECILYLNQYKTQKMYGNQIIKINDNDLIRLIIMKVNKGGKYLLTNYRNYNKPLTDGNLGKRITMLCDNYLKKHITINTIRQIGETDNINSNAYKSSSIKDKEKMHNKLQHSFMMGHYYAKTITN
jgi:hypothetical protein